MAARFRLIGVHPPPAAPNTGLDRKLAARIEVRSIYGTYEFTYPGSDLDCRQITRIARLRLGSALIAVACALGSHFAPNVKWPLIWLFIVFAVVSFWFLIKVFVQQRAAARKEAWYLQHRAHEHDDAG